MSKPSGSLYLIPTLLGESTMERNVPFYNLSVIHNIRDFIVEEIKVARSFLKKAAYPHPFDEVNFNILDEQTLPEESIDFLNPAREGRDIGLLSGAGLPCVADPGADLVARAHQLKIRVVPLTGPSSIFLALMASGFNGQNFSFNGYLPVDKQERKNKIRELERRARLEHQTQIFIETPYRNMQMLDSLLNTCSNSTRICIACNITTENELIISKTVTEWKNTSIPELNKKPVVFLLY